MMMMTEHKVLYRSTPSTVCCCLVSVDVLVVRFLIINAFKFPLVGKFTKQALCTIPLTDRDFFSNQNRIFM